MRRLAITLAVFLFTFVAILSVVGCGETKKDLDYDKSSTNPVIIYRHYQAIAPQYIPNAPREIVYGDGTLIRREDTFDYVSGDLEEGGVEGILETLSEEGFFDLEEEYEGEPMPGAATEFMEVRLSSGTYTVTVGPGSDITGWDDMVSAVTDVNIRGSKEYVPGRLRLFASVVEDGAEDAEELQWPGDEDDLARADSAGSSGLELEGDEANEAWTAILEAQEVGEEGGEIVFQSGGRVYANVYAEPLFPGLSG